ncbi:cytochrome c-type biogenesis protein [Marinobacterium jannaschii]|uniref:cytochrome c-type biogenesis protein n=1 Tax=Marinobacterium jannaschii TaxID=64970 RepID=UPI000486AF08|nr:cytochrome c-type biogenesis protein [Marinobacterium jannaschii]
MKRLITLLILLFPLTLQAAIDTYEFRDEETRKRFLVLTAELRCPKCQNQNLADSNSPIAEDLRGEVYRMLEKGESDTDIIDFMVVRYGEFVLYRPRLSSETYLLWYGPAALVVIGVVVVLLVTRRRRKNTGQVVESESSSGLDEAEQQRLKRLLDQDSDK